MASDIPADDYDENSVFNRIFAEIKRDPNANAASRLERIFAEVETPAETLNVTDFLPSF